VEEEEQEEEEEGESLFAHRPVTWHLRIRSPRRG
jgi:hypothetical protein